jgi:hypothetical protein
MSEILCPFGTDPVVPKIQSGVCLYWCVMVTMECIGRKVLSPCCCAVLELDVVLLQHQYCCWKDREWWVSILMYNGDYGIYQKTSCLTLLWCSAWAKCCAPLSSIVFSRRFRVVSVYIDVWRWYGIDEKKSSLTVLLCSALARCRAPSGPIWFDSRSRVVSVYIDV